MTPLLLSINLFLFIQIVTDRVVSFSAIKYLFLRIKLLVFSWLKLFLFLNQLLCDFYKLLDDIITDLSFICHQRRFWFTSNLQFTFLFKIHGYAQTNYLMNIEFSTIESKIFTYFKAPMKIWTFEKLRPV